MILVEIQENIIKTKNALANFETDQTYRLYRALGGYGKFENKLRETLNKLINLRNRVVVHTEAIIRKTENKELLRLVDSGFFSKICDAMSRDKIYTLFASTPSLIPMPETSARIVFENSEIDVLMEKISVDINDYNYIVSELRQEQNKIFFTLYSIPKPNELPDTIDTSISVFRILYSTEYPRAIEKAESTTTKPLADSTEVTGKLKIKMRGK